MPLLNFSTNDYLNLAGGASESSFRKQPSGACSSRLISGTSATHLSLESELAEFLSQEASLVFGSGYLANLGLASSLLRREDMVFADRLLHASLIDSILLSRAKCRRFRHNDVSHLEKLLSKEYERRKPNQRFLILTESVFSMDGDLAPLQDLMSLANRYEAEVIVDEAHAIGVFGPQGRGCVAESRLSSDVVAITGSFGKSFASYGGFIAGSELVRSLCVQQSRSFIYNTALPSSLAEDTLYSLEAIRSNSTAGAELLKRARVFRNLLVDSGLSVAQSESQIVPIVLGDSERALSVARTLAEEGIFCHAIRPPTVPKGKERLRFSVTLAHPPEQLAWVAQRLRYHLLEKQ